MERAGALVAARDILGSSPRETPASTDDDLLLGRARTAARLGRAQGVEPFLIAARLATCATDHLHQQAAVVAMSDSASASGSQYDLSTGSCVLAVRHWYAGASSASVQVLTPMLAIACNCTVRRG